MVNRLKHRISIDGILAFWPALMIDILKGEFAQRQQILHFPTIWIPKVEILIYALIYKAVRSLLELYR